MDEVTKNFVKYVNFFQQSVTPNINQSLNQLIRQLVKTHLFKRHKLRMNKKYWIELARKAISFLSLTALKFWFQCILYSNLAKNVLTTVDIFNFYLLVEVKAGRVHLQCVEWQVTLCDPI